MKKQLSRITAKGDTAEILIYEEIGESFFGGLGAKEFIQNLKALGSDVALTVRINSRGGDVFDGVSIYHALKDHAGPVSVVVDGMAASIASLIAMAGDTVKMQPLAFLMIHDASCGMFGNSNTHREVAEVLDSVSDKMREAYGRATLSPVELKALMSAGDTWYSAEEAIASGFADGLVEKPLKMAASAKDYHLENFKNVPNVLQIREKLAKTVANEGDSSDSCTCPCPECLLGDCADCSDPDCDCAGCTCDAAMGASAAAAAKIQQASMIAVAVRDRSLRLAQSEFD